ncbi:MAG: CaiB/BaiF CoA transferase family protein [Hyphomicrobiaceae bacterium]
MPDLILEGITVVDMTEGVAGPCTTMLLADMGATVTKVERKAGDWQRTTGTAHFAGLGSAFFLALNRNKRDVGLDVASADGQEAMRRLVAKADIIVSNYRPGVMGKLGLGYDACRALNERIIYCTISGFGQDGPYAQLPASDTVVQAVSGVMQMVGEANGPPLRVGFPLTDMTAANHAVQAILLALYGRATGRKAASEIDISLTAAALGLQNASFSEFLLAGTLPKRQGNQNMSLAPAGAFEVAGGRYISIAVLRDEHWVKLCAALDLPALVEDARFKTNAARLTNREQLDAIIEPIFIGGSMDYWLDRLRAADILCGPINTFADIAADSALASGLPLVETMLPGHDRVFGSPIRMDGSYFATRSPPPGKGQHTREILAELGFNTEDVRRMLESGAAFEMARD